MSFLNVARAPRAASAEVRENRSVTSSGPYPSRPRRRRRRWPWILTACLVVLVLACAGLTFLFRQTIADLVAANGFSPSSQLQQLVSATTMTPEATRTFYATRPEIDGTQSFNTDCSGTDARPEGTNLLGCYVVRSAFPVLDDSIYLYPVTDARLDGVMQVSAAHEMLHAAYARLSPDERARLQTQLLDEYARLTAADPALAERMNAYQDLDDEQLANELHSILGTEVADLSPALEAYYTRYFTDRHAIVSLYQGYSSVFTTLTETIAQLQQQLAELGASIQERSASYTSALDQLNADIEDFNSRAQTPGAFPSDAQFQDERQELLDRGAQLNAERDAINADVDRFNALKAQLDALGAESDQLRQDLDSTLAPPPSVG